MPTALDTYYLKCHNAAADVTDWPLGQVRYYLYPNSWDAPTAQAAFLALGLSQQLAQSTTSEPTPTAGYSWVAITSSGTGGSGFDTSYVFSQPGSDYLGHAFVDSPAPALVAIVQAAPREKGSQYNFSPQTALNTFLSRRHPAFSLHPSWQVVYAGPGFVQQAERDPVLTRGYSLLAENVPNRGLFSRTRLAPLVPGGYDIAKLAADSLPAGDARKPWLLEWYNQGGNSSAPHYLIDNPDAGKLFGRYLYADLQGGGWTNGSPLWGITPNFEVYTASSRSTNGVESQWRNMDGYVMQGVKEAFDADLAAKQDGRTLPQLICYDWATMCHFSIALKSRDQQSSGVYGDLEPAVSYDPEPGVPFYFSYASIGDNFKGGSKTAPLLANNPYSQYLKDNGGYAGSAEYMRNTWDDQTLWVKDGQGNFTTRVVSGVTLRVPRWDARRTTINGETCDILGDGYFSVGESANFLYLTYERIQQAIVDTYLRAGGKHLPLSTDRQAGWEKLKLVQWARFEGEFKQPNEVQTTDGSGWKVNPATGQPYVQEELNHRPLNGHFVERDIIAHLMLGRDMYRFWMEPQPELDSQGAANSNAHSRAAHELAQKAMQRVSLLNWTRENAFQYLLPQYLIRNIARDRSWYDPAEEFEKKPILFGGLCPSRADRQNKPWLWFFGSYPAQDLAEQTRVYYWWVDAQGNALTPAYTFLMVGRDTFLDDHQVPDAVAGLAPSRLRIQLTDLMGEKHTLTGSYLDTRITNHPTPPALA